MSSSSSTPPDDSSSSSSTTAPEQATAPSEPAQSPPAEQQPTTEPPPSPPAPAPGWSPPTTSLRARFWPDTRAARVVFVVLALAFLAFLVRLIALRYAGMFHEFSADGDQPQAVWHYWRYNKAGAFPPGHLTTDYAFVMHAPPGWWLMMAPLSTLMSPLTAAKVINLVAFVGTHFVIWAAVARRSNAFVGLAAAFLLARNADFSAIIAGGYARSFGPMLTLAFLGAFWAGSHRLVLVVLVVQAALYPSVVIPCGFAYGVYTVVKGPMPLRLRRMGGMFIAGLLIIAFGKFQDLRSPAWWGELVTLKEAMTMPAWQSGGRVPEAPLRPAIVEIERNLERGFRTYGQVPLPAVGKWVEQQDYVVVFGAILAGMAAVPLLWWRARRRGQDFVDAFPWQLPAVFFAALVAYFLARFLAFKLYLPYRPLQHVWSYCFYAGIPLLAWCLARNTIRNTAAATVVAVVVAVGPIVLLFGNGNDPGPANYGSNASNAKLYRWMQKQPIEAIFGGEVSFIDKTPLFTWHRSYITKNLAHPFRRGYYDECERRIRRMYEAMYATNLQAVVDFAQAEQVDFLIVRNATFDDVDSRLFQPVKRDMTRVFKRNKKAGFALKTVPKETVVFRDRGIFIIDMKKLAVAVKNGAGAPRPLGPEPLTPPPPTDAKEGADDAADAAGDTAGDAPADGAETL